MSHCWADELTCIETQHGYLSEAYCDYVVSGKDAVCMLEAGHGGEHDFTSTDEIVVRCGEGEQPMSWPVDSCFILLVRTNKYAGNFEREMCAFMTGVTGECEVGGTEAESYRAAHPGDDRWVDRLMQVADDNGCYRPASLWSASAQDVAIFMESRPTQMECGALAARARAFAEQWECPLTIEGVDLVRYTVERTETVVVRAL